MNGIIEKRLDGLVTVEIYDNFVKLYKNGVEKLSKKKKAEILEEFKGRPVIDFRRGSCGGLVMNDIVCVIEDGIEFELFKKTLVDVHSRSRSGVVVQKGENEIELLSESKGVNIHVSFWDDKRKFMAQGHTDHLSIFLNYYVSTINAIKNTERISSKELKLSQTWSMVPEEIELPVPEVNMTMQHDINTEILSVPVTPAKTKATHTSSISVEITPSRDSAFSDELARMQRTSPEVNQVEGSLKESVFVSFQQSVMKELHEVKESIKTILLKIPSMTDISDRLEKVDRDQKQQNSDQNSRILVLEEEIEKLKKGMNEAKESKRSIKASINHHAAEIGAVRDNISNIRADLVCSPVIEIKEIRESIGKLKEGFEEHQLKSDALFSSLRKEKQCVSQSVDSLRESIPTHHTEDGASLLPHADNRDAEHSSAHSQQPAGIAPQVTAVTPTIDCPSLPKHPANSNDKGVTPTLPSHVFDADVIIFVDSNGKHMREEIMDKGTKVAKVMCYTIPQAIDIIKTATFVRKPHKVLFHLGTNDIESALPQAVANSLDTLLYETRVRLNATQLFVSAIMLRKDLMERVSETNALFQDIIAKYYGSFLKHKYIKDSMLGDKKHLNDQGFYLLLAYYRLVLFGTWPKLHFWPR